MPAHDDLILLREAAIEAGSIALQYWKQSPKAWEKDGGAGPVSEADLAVNEMLATRLRSARPDYGWLSEETLDSDARQKCEHVFIIDPIDGTRAFMAGESHFAHSLAIAQRGQVTAAAVFLPALDRMYLATLDSPATCNGVPIQASTATDAAASEILANKASIAPEHWAAGAPPFKRNFRASLAYRLCLVAEGRFDGMITFRPTWEWDIAAGALIASRAGAAVRDRGGLALGFNHPDPRTNGVLALAPGLHQQIIGALKT
ncbi:MAG: 3'(2'),5'-bisphosphate nucleotidase CysQ [Microgenomates group bacterium]